MATGDKLAEVWLACYTAALAGGWEPPDFEERMEEDGNDFDAVTVLADFHHDLADEGVHRYVEMTEKKPKRARGRRTRRNEDEDE
jgi:hypothetical protein